MADVRIGADGAACHVSYSWSTAADIGLLLPRVLSCIHIRQKHWSLIVQSSMAVCFEFSLLVAGHVGVVNALVSSSDERFVISAGGDAMVRVWNSDDLTLVRTLRGHRGSVLCLVSIGSILVSSGRDNTIRCGRMGHQPPGLDAHF
ncbi:hypothetical protein DUNSADRAFT_7173, partial [Dunaliella salina]